MSTNIEIIQKGLKKQAIDPLKLTEGLGYGVYENNRLTRGKPGDNIILYDKNHIGRGISLDWHADEKKKISLRMLCPTCEEEIDLFYDIVRRVRSQWKNCVVKQEGAVLKPDDIDSECANMKKFNKDFIKDVLCKKEGVHSLFSAMWQLDLGDEDKKDILASPDPAKTFGDWLHRLQEMDVYYAVPTFLGKNGEIKGTYFITEGVPSVIPLVPAVPFGVTLNGKPLKTDIWMVNFFSDSQERILGETDYNRFAEKIKDRCSRYDACKVITPPLSIEDMEKLLEE